LHVRRRVSLRQVERLEVVPIVLDLRSFLDRVSDTREDDLELLAHLAQHVRMAALERGARESDVDLLGLADVRQTRGLVLRASRRQRCLHRPLRLVGLLAERGALRGIELRYARQQLAADLAVAAAQVLDLDRFQLGVVACLRDGGECAVAKLCGVAHPAFLRAISNRITAPAAAAVRQMAPTLPGSCTRSSTTSGQPASRAARAASAGVASCTRATAITP